MVEYMEQKISAEAFNALTDSVGWGTRDAAVVVEALDHTLYSVCALADGRPVGYARLIGDKTIFLYVQDVMAHPDFQGRGIGTRLMELLVQKILEYKAASPDLRAYLGASRGRESFYRRFGFLTRREAELGEGMVLL